MKSSDGKICNKAMNMNLTVGPKRAGKNLINAFVHNWFDTS